MVLNMEELNKVNSDNSTCGYKININYYLEDKVDEDIQEEIFDYFMQAESDDQWR